MKENNFSYDPYFDSAINSLKKGAIVMGVFAKTFYQETEETREILQYLWWRNWQKLTQH